jgi:hypothetical protein
MSSNAEGERDTLARARTSRLRMAALSGKPFNSKTPREQNPNAAASSAIGT